MVISSGIVLDSYSNVGVSGVTISVYSVTGTVVLATAIGDSNGYFEVDIPNSSTDFIYTPYKPGHKGFSRVCSPNLTYLNLFVNLEFPIQTYSGTEILNLFNTGLVTSLVINDIAATPCNYYIATNNGLDIIDVNTLNNVGYFVRSGGYSSIALSRDSCTRSGVFLGTTNSGVYRFAPPQDFDLQSRSLSGSLFTLTNSISQGNLNSNNIQCLDINSRGERLIGTASGIEVITLSGRRSHNYPTAIGTTACVLSNEGDVYYSPTNSGLYVKYSPIASDWVEPDYKVVLSGTGVNPFPLLSNYINSVRVTSVSGTSNNSVFLATRSGFIAYTEDVNLNISASGSLLIRSLT